MRIRSIGVVLAGAALVLASGSAGAVSLGGFSCITGNDAGDCAIGEAQLEAELVEGVSGFAWLAITNLGPEYSVVEQVFIESASVLTGVYVGSLEEGLVFFLTDWAGGNLPGGNEPAVNFQVDTSLSSTNPDPLWGIGPHPQDPEAPQTGVFGLFYTGSFDDFLAGIRVGVHVIGFADDGSEAFVTGGPAIPEPAAAAVFALGLLVVGGRVAARRS